MTRLAGYLGLSKAGVVELAVRRLYRGEEPRSGSVPTVPAEWVEELRTWDKTLGER